MSPEQLRAARNWLGWNQQDLATRAKVGVSTVKDYEAGKRTPMANNLLAMEKALIDAGIAFGERSIAGPTMGKPHPDRVTQSQDGAV